MPRHLNDHPDRVKLANELHARPFALIDTPFRVSHIALSCPPESLDATHEHLVALCDHFGAPQPTNRAPQLILNLGRFRFKWERHTEFIAITIIAPPSSPDHTPFDVPAIQLLPEKWLESLPGTLLAAIHVHGESVNAMGDAPVPPHLAPHFSEQSLIGGRFFEDRARFWGDFRIHEDGFMRFAVQAVEGFQTALMGRIVQRLIEVETYRATSMLALPAARGVWPQLNEIDAALAEVTSAIGAGSARTEQLLLDRIIELAAEIEEITSANAFRLDASLAYSAIVWRRLEVLSATPLPGLIDLKAFMMRRYDPAMRTCEATRARLTTLAERAGRVATLLRTRIEVKLEEQNRQVLSSMDRRSAQQLRLQETVEGLSVVAIGYYAVSLVALVIAPFAKSVGISETWAKALVVVPVIVLVWAFVRRVKARAMEAANQPPGES